jgi:acetylglutamate kinase
MKKSLKKDTILKLLSSMSSEKEIRKYLERFSSDDYRFAVIKVGGAVIQSDLENLVTSLAFLNEVGLRPIIIHGGGPKLSDELNKRKIEFSFLNGQRVTTKEVLDVAYKIFSGENTKIVSALKDQEVEAIPVIGDIFLCNIDNEELGFVGNIEEINSKKIKDIISSGGIPVIAPIGNINSNQYVNINGDKATLALAKEIVPDKVIFLSEIGGIYDSNEKLISHINIKDDYKTLMEQAWLHSGMRLKLEQIKLLLDCLPRNSSVSITKPLHLNRELFTDAGYGTLVKSGHQIDKLKSLDSDQKNILVSILESSFKGTLNNKYFKDHDKEFYLSKCNRASIITTSYKNITYMDKFAVISSARGEGLGNAMWNKMTSEHKKIFWRSRANNAINNFYKDVCDGFQKSNGWNIFWIGIDNLDELTECINYAVKQPATISYEN